MCKSDTHAGTRKAALAEMCIWAEQTRSGECQVCQPVGLMRNLRFENKNLLAGQPSDGRAERARPVAGTLGNLSLAGMSSAQTQKTHDFQVHQQVRHRGASPGRLGEGRVS